MENSSFQRVIDVLKMDIEYNEWACFKTMLKEGVLRNIRQLMFEIHTNPYGKRGQTSKEEFKMMYDILLDIEKEGFRRFHFHRNPSRKYISTRSGKERFPFYELYYINVNFLQIA